MTGARDDTAGLVAGFRPHQRLRTSPLGTWYRATDPDGADAGLLAVGQLTDLDTLVTVTARLREANLPTVLAVHDLVSQDGKAWLITTGPPGPTLRDITDGGSPPDPYSVLTLAADCAEALLSLHELGLVHGRFGPDSVIVDGKGGIRLGDWGQPGTATSEDDTQAWVELTWSLATRWCAGDFVAGVGIAHAAGVALTRGLTDGLDELRRIMDDPPPRSWWASAALAWTAQPALAPDTPTAKLIPADSGPPLAAPPERTQPADTTQPAYATQPVDLPSPPEPVAAPGETTVTQLGARRGRAASAPGAGPDRLVRFGPGVGGPDVQQVWRGQPKPVPGPTQDIDSTLRFLRTIMITAVIAAVLLFGLYWLMPH
jgi:hypothetical protein